MDQCEALVSLPARAPSRRPATPFELSWPLLDSVFSLFEIDESMELWSPVPAWSNVWVRMAVHWEHLSSRLKKKEKRLSSSFSRFHLRLRRAFFPVFNSSPARFELRVVGRPSRFASSRPAKKVKGSGQRVGGRCRTAWLIHLRYSLIEESCKAFRASVPTIFLKKMKAD